MKLDKLLFGTAGIPLSTTGNTVEGIGQVRKLGLDAMELEFVRNINISKDKAPLVKSAAEKNKIILTCHAPYYINLNATDKAITKASADRILNSARILYLCGGYSACFHAAYYMKSSKEEALQNVTKQVAEIVKILRNECVDVWIRPELSGRVAQFGSLEEIISISENVEGVLPCIDFSHYHARTNGKFNTYSEFSVILSNMEKSLGKSALQNMHIHVSGINYGEKGEKNHLNLLDSDMNYTDLIQAFCDFKLNGIIISESPNIEGDAILMKKTFEKLH